MSPAPQTLSRRIRAACATFWLNLLFHHGMHRPWLVRLTKPFFLFFAWRFAASLREGPIANARWLLGEQSSRAQRVRFGKNVVSSFYDFVHDISQCARMTPQQMRTLVESIQGQEQYRAARALKRGAIFVTAHLGSFEIAVAGLQPLEQHIHVVYRPDAADLFETLRASQRAKLGVIGENVDEGLAMWMRLRDALAQDHVVLIQGDRVMPGQSGINMPFCGGHMPMPPGPVKLAIATGAPIIPVFACWSPARKLRITIEPAITMPAQPQPVNEHHPAMLELARAIEKHVKANPEQWHVLQRAWCEDQPERPGA